MNSVPQKTCTYCKKTFPATREFFYAHKTLKDGLQTRCKECLKKKEHKHRVAVPLGYKHCPQCSTTKPFDSFHSSQDRKDGIGGTCKDCLKKIGPLRYQQAKLNGPSLIPPDEMTCKRCNITKPFNQTNFPVHPGCRYGMLEICKDCNYQNTKKWVQKNRTRLNARHRSYYPRRKQYFADRYQTRKEILHSYFKEFKLADPERVLDRNRRYSHTDNGRLHKRVNSRQYQARKFGAKGRYTPEDVLTQYTRQKGHCYYCKKRVGKQYHVDHIVPLARGGSNGPENLVIACPTCNLRKGFKLLHEWTEGGHLM